METAKGNNKLEVITSDADHAARVEAAMRTLTEVGVLEWRQGIDECEFVATLSVAIEEIEGDRTNEWVRQLRFDKHGDEEHEVRSIAYSASQELWNAVENLAQNSLALGEAQ